MLKYSYVDTRNSYQIPLAWLQAYRGDTHVGDHRLTPESLDRVLAACDRSSFLHASSHQPSSSISDPLQANLMQNTPGGLDALSDSQQPLSPVPVTTSTPQAYPSPTSDEHLYDAETTTEGQHWNWWAFIRRVIASFGQAVAYLVGGIVR